MTAIPSGPTSPCRQCGEQVPQTAQFCPFCGHNRPFEATEPALTASRLASAGSDPTTPPTESDFIEQLERLARLREAGMLDADEFRRAKAKLLA